eukprot:jgi/Mesvir1/26273/Mv01636-RA.1
MRTIRLLQALAVALWAFHALDAVPALPAPALPVRGLCRVSILGKPAKPSTAEVTVTRGGKKQVAPPQSAEVKLAIRRLTAPLTRAATGSTCFLALKNCASSSWVTSKVSKKYRFSKDDVRTNNLPLLRPGELGTCALVGNADTLLGKRLGKEIDAHNTVFRYNTPIPGELIADLGQKVTVMWLKQGYQAMGGPVSSSRLPTRFFMAPRQVPADLLIRGRKVLMFGPGLSTFQKQADDLYAAYEKERHLFTRRDASLVKGYGLDAAGFTPSRGFKRAMAVILSGLCSRVDMYGWSSGGGKYFDRTAMSMKIHLMPLEHFVYRTIMGIPQASVCIFGD